MTPEARLRALAERGTMVREIETALHEIDVDTTLPLDERYVRLVVALRDVGLVPRPPQTNDWRAKDTPRTYGAGEGFYIRLVDGRRLVDVVAPTVDETNDLSRLVLEALRAHAADGEARG